MRGGEDERRRGREDARMRGEEGERMKGLEGEGNRCGTFMKHVLVSGAEAYLLEFEGLFHCAACVCVCVCVCVEECLSLAAEVRPRLADWVAGLGGRTGWQGWALMVIKGDACPPLRHFTGQMAA